MGNSAASSSGKGTQIFFDQGEKGLVVCPGAAVIEEPALSTQQMVAKERENTVLAESIPANQRNYLAIAGPDGRQVIQQLMAVALPHDIAVEPQSVNQRPFEREGVRPTRNAVQINDQLNGIAKAMVRVPFQKSQDQLFQGQGKYLC
jgi:hypothetical protein